MEIWDDDPQYFCSLKFLYLLFLGFFFWYVHIHIHTSTSYPATPNPNGRYTEVHLGTSPEGVSRTGVASRMQRQFFENSFLLDCDERKRLNSATHINNIVRPPNEHYREKV